MCPDCRFVFRVPRDHDGKGVICPNCRRMLRTPASGEPTPPLVARNRKIAPISLPESFQKVREKSREAPSATPQAESKTRRRAHSSPAEEQPDWEKIPGQRVRVSKKSPKFNSRNLVVAGMAVLLALVGTIYMIQRRQAGKPFEAGVVATASQKPVDHGPQPEKIELPLEMNRNETELIAELEPLTRKFLEATTVEEILPLIRDRERVEPMIRKEYPDGKIQPKGLGAFNTSGSIAYRSKLASVTVRSKDFESLQLAYIRTGEGMKIDWESYIGWSEMRWPEFLTAKTSKPTLFRASLKLVEYYNFSFSDDKKWQSYQLRSPDGESVVYGYVLRDSEVDKKLRPDEKTETRLVTVLLKFQPGETSKNQVLIGKVVADGWVEGVD